MLLREVEYAKPSSVADALALLAENDGARALAGGQTLVNVMKARAASPDMLVDLNAIEALKGIELAADGTLSIGPMTTCSEIIGSAEAKARPILGEVCAQIADVQVRNRGTIGGNICSNDPTNHLPPLLAAIGAQMTIAGVDGERVVPADEFFLGVYMTAVGPGELLTRITIPAGQARRVRGGDARRRRDVHRERRGERQRVASDRARLRRLRPGHPRARHDLNRVRAAVRGAGLDPPSDVHASSEYRLHLAEVLAVRAAHQARRRGA